MKERFVDFLECPEPISEAHSPEWEEGAEACFDGQTYWENPYDEGTEEAVQWASGWLSEDFDQRVDFMEGHHAA